VDRARHNLEILKEAGLASRTPEGRAKRRAAEAGAAMQSAAPSVAAPEPGGTAVPDETFDARMHDPVPAGEPEAEVFDAR
jgi:hypothetical protein